MKVELPSGRALLERFWFVAALVSPIPVGLLWRRGGAAPRGARSLPRAVRLPTKATAVAHAMDGVRANSIYPGAVDTPGLREAIDLAADPAAVEAQLAVAQPIGRLGRPEEVAYGCLYLASDESTFCIGSELSIDGGMVAH